MKSGIVFSVLLSLLLSVPIFARDYDEADMESFGRHAAMGETDAIDKLDQAFTELTKGINYQTDMARAYTNAALMRIAFAKIADEVNGDDTNPAFQSLIYATGKPNLAGFAAEAFGTAAAAGHAPSLDVLLNYKQHGILYSSAVLAMVPVAATNNKAAVDFLVAVINSDKSKGLWLAASQGLTAAANDGNPDAKAALAKYAASSN